MNDDITVAVKVLGALAGAALLSWIGIVMVKAAKRGGGGLGGIGAALMLFGWGNLRDPANNPVAEARDGRIRRDEYSGDPLDPEKH
jgi:hypothetical protein